MNRRDFGKAVATAGAAFAAGRALAGPATSDIALQISFALSSNSRSCSTIPGIDRPEFSVSRVARRGRIAHHGGKAGDSFPAEQGRHRVVVLSGEPDYRAGRAVGAPLTDRETRFRD